MRDVVIRLGYLMAACGGVIVGWVFVSGHWRDLLPGEAERHDDDWFERP